MSTTATKSNAGLAKTNTEIAQQASKPTVAQSFVSKIELEYQSELGKSLNWTPVEKVLAQHLFVAIDEALVTHEIKRQTTEAKKNDPPVTWDNIDTPKLARQIAHKIVPLGIDAAFPNEVHPIPYLNSRTGKYDFRLSIGWQAKLRGFLKFALKPLRDIRVELVHDDDTFIVAANEFGGQMPRHTKANPFKPGEVIGGYIWLMYPNPADDRVIPIEYREFEKAKNASQGGEFWGGKKTFFKKDGSSWTKDFGDKFEKEMQYKTLIHRIEKYVQLDYSKIHAEALLTLRSEDLDITEAEFSETADVLANSETLSLPSQSEAELSSGDVGPKDKGARKDAPDSQVPTPSAASDEDEW